MTVPGIDISNYQKGFQLQKNNGYDFAILRGGYTGWGASRTKNKDASFENFYRQAKEIGLPVGVYWYSCANTKQGGIDEALFLYDNCLKGKQFEYPIYIDVEDEHWQNTNKAGVTDAIIGFCETLEGLGFFVGVYASSFWFSERIDTDRLNGYTKWVANWSARNKPAFRWNAFDLWQNSNNGVFSGWVIDTDISYRNFPEIIKNGGFNGYKKEEQKPVDSVVSDNEKIVNEVLEHCEAIKRLMGALETGA